MSDTKTLQEMGEFGLIETITQGFCQYHAVHTGVGDDAAVIPNGDAFTLLTVDSLVEGDHFRCDWATPEQIGRKAAEVNVSDIAAMGGDPAYALVALVLSSDTPDDWVNGVYDGLRESFAQHGVTLLGGDTTHGAVRMLSITLLGKTKKPILRSGARAGDLICVTGQVGGSAAGWHSLRKGVKATEYTQFRHLNPKCRLTASRSLRAFATSMIDVSDGVGSEVRHLCTQSGTGAVVQFAAVPVHPSVTATEQQLGLKPGTCAFSGGEDFELLFTLKSSDEPKLRLLFDDFTVIGTMTEEAMQRDLVLPDGTVVPIPKGWDHTQHLS